MFKKLLVATVAVVVGLAVISGTRVGSRWFSHMKARTARWAEKQITPEMEVAHLRDRINQLKGDDALLESKIQEQNVKVSQRQKELDPSEKLFISADKRLTELRPAVHEAKHSNRQTVSYNGHEYTIKEAEEQLSLDWAFVKENEGLVKSRRQYIAKLQEGVKQMRDQQKVQEKLRVDMLTELQDLENRLVEVREAQAVNGATNGDAYARVRAEIETQKEKIKGMGTANVGRQRGPIEVSEDERSRKAKAEQELNTRYPVTGKPGLPVAAKN